MLTAGEGPPALHRARRSLNRLDRRGFVDALVVAKERRVALLVHAAADRLSRVVRAAHWRITVAGVGLRDMEVVAAVWPSILSSTRAVRDVVRVIGRVTLGAAGVRVAAAVSADALLHVLVRRRRRWRRRWRRRQRIKARWLARGFWDRGDEVGLPLGRALRGPIVAHALPVTSAAALHAEIRPAIAANVRPRSCEI